MLRGAAFLGGILLLILNGIGFIVPLRAPELGTYEDFARSGTIAYGDALQRLSALDPANRVELVTQATHVFHEAMVQINLEDIREKGFAHYGMRVPARENYLLYGLSFLKPDTYRDYEFCSYRKALARGTGRCGQQALALVDFLVGHGLKTGFVSIKNHTLATAEVAEGVWYLLDPNFGGVVPFDLEQAERDPLAVLPYYWSDAARTRRIQEHYAADGNFVYYGGPGARYGRAYPIERVAYLMKWVLPLLLMAPFLASLLRRQAAGAADSRRSIGFDAEGVGETELKEYDIPGVGASTAPPQTSAKPPRRVPSS